MNTKIKLSRVQKAIKRVLDDFIKVHNNRLGVNIHSKYSFSESLMFCFHDNKSINVDGDLYDILLYGSADYSFGIKLGENIHSAVNKLGYFLEYEGQGIYNIVKD